VLQADASTAAAQREEKGERFVLRGGVIRESEFGARSGNGPPGKRGRKEKRALTRKGGGRASEKILGGHSKGDISRANYSRSEFSSGGLSRPMREAKTPGRSLDKEEASCQRVRGPL